MGREDGDRALGDLILELVDEDRAALAQRLHDVLVVDDLLPHVDRRAVQLERAFDGLDSAVDAAQYPRGAASSLFSGACVGLRW